MKKRAWIVFSGESGVSLLPRIRRTYAPRGRTPVLRHRLNRERASMAAALGYHATDPARGPRLCFRLKPGSYNTASLTEVLEQVKTFYAGEPVILVRDGLSAHWSRGMRAWAADQDWLTLERLPAYCSIPHSMGICPDDRSVSGVGCRAMVLRVRQDSRSGERAMVLRLARARKAPRDLAMRARMVELSWAGETVPAIAWELVCSEKPLSYRSRGRF